MATLNKPKAFKIKCASCGKIITVNRDDSHPNECFACKIWGIISKGKFYNLKDIKFKVDIPLWKRIYLILKDHKRKIFDQHEEYDLWFYSECYSKLKKKKVLI